MWQRACESPAAAEVTDLSPEERERLNRWRHALTTLPTHQSLPAEFERDFKTILRAVNPPKNGTLEKARTASREFRTTPVGRGLADAMKSAMGRRVVEELDAEAAASAVTDAATGADANAASR